VTLYLQHKYSDKAAKRIMTNSVIMFVAIWISALRFILQVHVVSLIICFPIFTFLALYIYGFSNTFTSIHFHLLYFCSLHFISILTIFEINPQYKHITYQFCVNCGIWIKIL